MADTISRRNLLAAAGAGIATLALPKTAFPKPTPKQDLSWEGIRALFDLNPNHIHMAGLLLASHPKPVQDAIDKYRKALNQNPVEAWHQYNQSAENAVRQKAAEYINARPQDIALTDSTTMGLSILYNGIAIRPDQEILQTTHDHAVTNESLRFRSERTKCKLKRIELYADPAKVTVEEVTTKLKAGIQPETRIVAVTWVHSSTGVRLPIAELAKVVAEANQGRTEDNRILFCVDGVHGFGVEDIDIQAMGCDFYSAGCHKWLFGPRGTGLLYGKPDAQRYVTPTIPTFTGPGAGWGGRMTPGGFHSFEHRWALAEAFALHQQIGKPRVRARIHEFAKHMKNELAKMPKITLYTPMSDDLSAGLICFDVQGLREQEVVAKLAERKIIASTTPYSPSHARLTPGLLNSEQDVEQTLAAVKGL